MLEDESRRIALGGAKLARQVAHLVTGVVVAVRGTVDDSGVMNVSVTFASCTSVVVMLLRYCILLGGFRALLDFHSQCLDLFTH